ncbi:MAG: hypothetical protein HC905_18595 [Bacteroidales bacterium]|nr:hypothetical protein [Bacteroidales bacterium]
MISKNLVLKKSLFIEKKHNPAKKATNNWAASATCSREKISRKNDKNAV